MTMNGRGPRRQAWEGRSVAEGFQREYPGFLSADSRPRVQTPPFLHPNLTKNTSSGAKAAYLHPDKQSGPAE